MNEPLSTRIRLAPDVRRASILDAATRLVLRTGAGGLTMEEVAQEAGVARGTLYLYFDSAGALAAALRERYTQALIDEAGPLLATGGSGSRLRRLDAFIAGMARAIEARQDLHHALFTQAGASEAPLLAAFHALLRRFIADGRDTGELDVPDADLAAAFLLAGLHAVLGEGRHRAGPGQAVAAAQKLARRTLSPAPTPADQPRPAADGGPDAKVRHGSVTDASPGWCAGGRVGGERSSAGGLAAGC